MSVPPLRARRAGPECEAAGQGGAKVARRACSTSDLAEGWRERSWPTDATGLGEATEAGV